MDEKGKNRRVKIQKSEVGISPVSWQCCAMGTGTKERNDLQEPSPSCAHHLSIHNTSMIGLPGW